MPSHRAALALLAAALLLFTATAVCPVGETAGTAAAGLGMALDVLVPATFVTACWVLSVIVWPGRQ